MSNDYFDSADYSALSRNTRALAEAVNAIADAIENGFDLLPAYLALRQNRATFVAADTGIANAYVVALAQTPPAYADGLYVVFRAATVNTTASTVNVSSLGLKDIRTFAGAALTGGEIIANGFTAMIYDATNGYFRIINPVIDVASVSVTNYIKAHASDAVPGVLDDKITVSGSLIKTTSDTGGGNYKVDIGLDDGQAALYSGVYQL